MLRYRTNCHLCPKSTLFTLATLEAFADRSLTSESVSHTRGELLHAGFTLLGASRFDDQIISKPEPATCDRVDVKAMQVLAQNRRRYGQCHRVRTAGIGLPEPPQSSTSSFTPGSTSIKRTVCSDASFHRSIGLSQIQTEQQDSQDRTSRRDAGFGLI